MKLQCPRSFVWKLEIFWSSLHKSYVMTIIKSELKIFVLLALLVTSLLLLSFSVLQSSCHFYDCCFSRCYLVYGCYRNIWLRVDITYGFDSTINCNWYPNCIYLINKFQQEFKNHGDKLSALDKIIQKVGNATFLTNATTALGFGTFVFTNSSIMIEFGLVSFINILCMFIISICLVPIIYSFLPPPREKHIKHLDRKWIFSFVNTLVIFSRSYRKQVYISQLYCYFLELMG